MKSKLSPRLVIASLALALGLSAGASAMPRGDSPNDHGARMMERHRAHGMEQMSRLHDELKLDAKQEALWQEAEKANKESMSGMHERFRKNHDETLSLLSQPGADLRAVAKRMDESRAESQKLHDANRDRWLAVYDTLNAEQKEKVRLFFKNKLERMERMHQQRAQGKN